MVVTWLVIAGLLYIPFKKWVATEGAPLISALLWPLILCLFGLVIAALPFVWLFNRIRGND